MIKTSTAVLIFYHPQGAESAFWSQILTVYSLLITCAIALFQTSLTRFHAAVATVIAGSPLNFYLLIYSIASFFIRKHRLRDLVGRGRMLPRCMMLFAGALWIALLIYVFVPPHLTHYAQKSCEGSYAIVSHLYVVPFMLLKSAARGSLWLTLLMTIPPAATIIGWIAALILQRKVIWPSGQRWSPQFRRVWYVP